MNVNTVLGGYKAIAYEGIKKGWGASCQVGIGLVGGAAGLVAGTVAAIGGLAIAAHGAGRFAYVGTATGLKCAGHTYSSFTPSYVQTRMEAVANSSPVKAVFSYCGEKMGSVSAYSEAKWDSLKDYAWETASARIVPLPFQGKDDPVARKQKHESYPERQTVLDHQVAWKYPFAKYAPPYFDAPSVVENEKAFGEKYIQVLGKYFTEKLGQPIEFTLEDYLSRGVRSIKESCEEKLSYEEGVPLNPRGRTGLAGRGVLPDWGPNYWVEPMVTRLNPETGGLEVLMVKQGKWTLPGGLSAIGEPLADTLLNVWKEQSGTQAPFIQGLTVHQEYVEDCRNTDNAWIERRVVHRHLGPEEGKCEPANKNVAWISVGERFDLEEIDESAAFALCKIQL